MDVAYGLRIRRGSYQTSVKAVAGEEISEQTASRDLKAMVDRGLLEAVGERRARYYLAGSEPSGLRKGIVAARPPQTPEDPFEMASSRRQLSLS